MTEIEKEAEEAYPVYMLFYPDGWRQYDSNYIPRQAYIAGRTETYEEKYHGPLLIKRIEILEEKLKSIRNSTIELCLKECEFFVNKGMLYMEHVRRALNALKK